MKRSSFQLHWEGDAEGCRPEADVREGIRRLLGADPETFPTEPLEVRAVVERQRGGWALTLDALGPQGKLERRLAAASCEDIVQAAALVVSMWLQSAARPEFRDSTDEPAAKEELIKVEPTGSDSKASMVRLSTGASGVALRQTRRLEWSLGAMALSGALPRASWGWIGRIGGRFGNWHGSASVFWLQERQTEALEPGRGGRFGLWGSGVRLGRSWALARGLNVQPGLWMLIGRLDGEGYGALSESTPSKGAWGASGIGLETQLMLGKLGISMGTGGGLPFGRPRYVLGDQVLYRVPAMTWHFELLMVAAFP